MGRDTVVYKNVFVSECVFLRTYVCQQACTLDSDQNMKIKGLIYQIKFMSNF